MNWRVYTIFLLPMNFLILNVFVEIVFRVFFVHRHNFRFRSIRFARANRLNLTRSTTVGSLENSKYWPYSVTKAFAPYRIPNRAISYVNRVPLRDTIVARIMPEQFSPSIVFKAAIKNWLALSPVGREVATLKWVVRKLSGLTQMYTCTYTVPGGRNVNRRPSYNSNAASLLWPYFPIIHTPRRL